MSSTMPSACESGFNGAHIQPPDHAVARPSTAAFSTTTHVEPAVSGRHRTREAPWRRCRSPTRRIPESPYRASALPIRGDRPGVAVRFWFHCGSQTPGTGGVHPVPLAGRPVRRPRHQPRLPKWTHRSWSARTHSARRSGSRSGSAPPPSGLRGRRPARGELLGVRPRRRGDVRYRAAPRGGHPGGPVPHRLGSAGGPATPRSGRRNAPSRTWRAPSASGTSTRAGSEHLPPEQIRVAFARLRARVADDPTVAPEFMPYSGVPDLATAWQVIEGVPNAGLIVDGVALGPRAPDPGRPRADPAGADRLCAAVRRARRADVAAARRVPRPPIAAGPRMRRRHRRPRARTDANTASSPWSRPSK